jgi:alanine racemase
VTRAVAEINLTAIAQNIALVKSKTSAQIMAVVKADAYGHGLVPVAETAISAGVTWLGVALLEEAIALRAAGIRAPIISWLTPPGEDFALALVSGIDLSVSSGMMFEEVLAAAKVTGITPRIHIEVDTGMSRGGFLADWNNFLTDLKAHVLEVHVVGIWSHFARADEPDEPATKKQQSEFAKRLKELREIGIEPDYTHLANSAATLTIPTSHQDIIRLGIAMYGLSPDVIHLGSSKKLQLKPAMTLKAKLNLVKKVPAGSEVGYGGTAKLKSDSYLGVVAIGYADGIPRNTSMAAQVVINGAPAPVIGLVSMDQFVVNLGAETQAKPGDWAVIFGENGNSVDDWAKAAATINYEIVTRIGCRVPRIYIR